MWKTRVLPALAAIALTTAGSVVTAGPASAAPLGYTVAVHGSAQGLTITNGQVRAGLVTFLVDTTNDQGSDVAMFSPAPGKTVDNVLADLRDEFSDDPQTAAQGTRELVNDARIFGLAGVVKGTPVTVTEQLAAGTYYLFDVNPVFAGAAPTLTTLQVSGAPSGVPRPGISFPLSGLLPFALLHSLIPGLPAIPILGAVFPVTGTVSLPGVLARGGLFTRHATVKLTSDDRFDGPDVLPAAGSITVRNVSDTIHFMDVSPVKPGTTDDDIQRFFQSDNRDQPPFALDGPSIEMGVLSPGGRADIGYNLPAGTYVLECFVSDDQTGMPHALMGMHKVVTLR
jgi:hypothetical protein